MIWLLNSMGKIEINGLGAFPGPYAEQRSQMWYEPRLTCILEYISEGSNHST